MTQAEFIKSIAFFIQKYAPQYNIKVCSPIIAQSILESAAGSSELAINAHNYFGLKYRVGRCPSSCGIYLKVGSEQNSDGSYTSSTMQWMKFATMELGVKGYFEFINISTYANLKGITDPETYLKNIKADGYATSINYVQNLMNVIKKYNLTQYDNLNNITNNSNNKLKINVHAGHNPDGQIACGAVGLIKESTEARIVKDKVISILKTQGHTVYDCTVENGISQNDVLKKIVTKCNANSVDLDVSIHFNAGVNDKVGNGTTTGTEVYIYSSTSKAKSYAQNIVNAIAALGFKNRGVKTSTSLYFLKNTKAPSLLVECCFVDDKDDINLYNADKMASAIVKGITGVSSVISSSTPPSSLTNSETSIELIGKINTKSSNLNIRSAPNSSSAKVGSYAKGTLVQLIAKTSTNWYRTDKGYISGEYVVAAKGKVSNCAKLNMRKEPKVVTGNVVSVLSVNDEVELLQDVNGWYNVKTKDNLVGYVSSKYITIL